MKGKVATIMLLAVVLFSFDLIFSAKPVQASIPQIQLKFRGLRRDACGTGLYADITFGSPSGPYPLTVHARSIPPFSRPDWAPQETYTYDYTILNSRDHFSGFMLPWYPYPAGTYTIVMWPDGWSPSDGVSVTFEITQAMVLRAYLHN